jgi:hypothetical protein
MNERFSVSIFGLILFGCLLTASVSQKIHLKFMPEVGKTYAYSYTTNLDKTTFGKTTHENLKGTISMEILEKLENRYRVKIQINLESSNMSPMVFNRMKQQNAEPRFITISDDYVWETQGAYNLCFPDHQVLVGDEWTDSASFHIGDLSTLDQPDVEVQYKIIKEEQIEDETCLTIICKPVEKEIEVPFQLGSLGIKCDEGGRIIAVDEKAEIDDKIRIGDQIVAIHGHKAANARARSTLFERYIETLDDIGRSVPITLLRDNKEITVSLKKHPVTIGTMRVEVQDFLRTVSFNLNKGIILSDVSKALYSVTYDFAEELPFVDDYTGKEPLKRLSKMEIPPRIYEYEWNLILNPLDL